MSEFSTRKSAIEDKIKDNSALTSEDYSWLQDPENFGKLDDNLRKYALLTYNEFYSEITDRLVVGEFVGSFLLNTFLTHGDGYVGTTGWGLVQPNSGIVIDVYSKDYDGKNRKSQKMTPGIKNGIMTTIQNGNYLSTTESLLSPSFGGYGWKFYYQCMGKTNFLDTKPLIESALTVMDTAFSETTYEMHKRAVEAATPFSTQGNQKERQKAWSNNIPTATPGKKGSVKEKKRKETLSATVQEQCVLLNFIEKISEAYDRVLMDNDFHQKDTSFLYCNLAHKINSETPDTILNSLILGNTSAASVFETSTDKSYKGATQKIYTRNSEGKITKTETVPVKMTKKDPKTGAIVNTKAYVDQFLNSFNDENMFDMTKINNNKYVNYREFANYPWIGDELVDIELNGTNPSTARSDIKINYTREIKSLAAALSDYNGTDSNDITSYTFGMISRQGENLQGKGRGRFYKNNYNVLDNKKALFTSLSSSQINNAKKQLTYGFDLSLVKHEFNIKDELAVTEVKLEHRGFTESLLYDPYLDVLGGKKLLEKRKSIEEGNIKKLYEKECSKEDIQEAEENFRLFNRTNLLNFKQRLSKRLTNLGAFSYLYYDESKFTYEKDDVIPTSDKGDEVDPQVNIYTKDPSNSDTAIKFFTFGDFVTVCMEMFATTPLSGVHTVNKSTDYDSVNFGTFKPVVLMTPFKFKKRGDTKAININIANLPISFDWYKTFMDDMYFKKRVEHIPIGQLLRDLLEIGISNMLSEVCFNGYLEKKLMFRVTSHKGTKKQYDELLTKKKESFKNNKFIQESDLTSLSAPLFSTYLDEKSGNSFYEQDDNNYYSYIYVHAQDPLESGVDYQSELAKKVAKGTIPVIKNLDASTKPYLYVKNFSWSKVENKYERERRYLNSPDFNPYVLGNVYNCTINLNFMVPFMYPGMIVYIDPYLGPDNVQAALVRGNRISVENSIGYQLGLTGFYLITKVKHKLKRTHGTGGQTSGDTELTCKNIIGMDAVVDKETNEQQKVCDQYVGLSEKILSIKGATISTENDDGTVKKEKINTEKPKEEKTQSTPEQDADQEEARLETVADAKMGLL